MTYDDRHLIQIKTITSASFEGLNIHYHSLSYQISVILVISVLTFNISVILYVSLLITKQKLTEINTSSYM
jgi:hypothetical protein